MSDDPARAGRRRALPKLAVELSVNIVLPWLVYTLLNPHYGDFVGLVASAAPPTLWSLYELLRFRVLDALSVLVLAGIALSLLAVGLGGSPRMLMVRENFLSVPIGLIFLASAATRRPVIYYLASAFYAAMRRKRVLGSSNPGKPQMCCGRCASCRPSGARGSPPRAPCWRCLRLPGRSAVS
ncbi:MAG: VC0807 family protein [Rhodospirillales bacterium]